MGYRDETGWCRSPPSSLPSPARTAPSKACKALMMAQGLAAVVLTPAHGDFNDDLAALGPRALAARLAPLLGPGTAP